MTNNGDSVLDRLYALLGDAVLIPVYFKTKKPVSADWQKLTRADSQNLYPELLAAVKRGGNIGVLLGPTSDRLLALDLDDDILVDEWLARHPWLANTLRTKGKRGCQFWMRLEGGCAYPNGRAIYRLPDSHGEIRLGGAGGAQSIVFGTHPDGMRYQVVVEKPPIEVSLADLDQLAPGILFASSGPVNHEVNGSARPVTNIWDRVNRYLDECPPAVSGERGHDTTFGALCAVIRHFDLSDDQAWQAAIYYNRKCEPPWSEKDLRHKVSDAWKATRNEARGDFVKDDSADTPFSRTLKKEQREREEAPICEEGNQPEAARVSLEEETQERFKQYLADPEPFPEPMRSEAFHGVIGEIARLMTEHCESSPEVLLLHGLVIIGNILGRSAYVYGGGPQLFPNEYAVFVGETARGRKGTAYAMWDQLVCVVNQDWVAGCLSRQNQSGEGIVHRVRDERYGFPPGKKKKNEPAEEVLLDAGVPDKRLLILEEEFSHALKMAQRSGNTLTEILRAAWDSPRSLRTSNKNSPLTATDPHVSLIGHTTRDELLSTLKAVDLNNGMANRVLWCAARRTGDMPDAQPIFWRAHSRIIERLTNAFRQRYANINEPAFFKRDPQAKNYWDALYRKLNGEKQSSTIDAVLARDTSHLLKLSLILAACDQVSEIAHSHLQAALAIVDYCRDSARWIFGQATGNKLANNLLWELRRAPQGLTRDQIKNDVCLRNTTKSQLDRALSDLVKNGLAKMALEKRQKGRPAERWFANV